MPFIQETFAPPGAGEEQHIKMLRAIADIVGAIHVATFGIVAGGTGYVVGDVLTLTGTGSGTAIFAARAIVTSVAAGVIDGIRVESAGAYSTAPDPTATSIATTGGTGTGATLTVTLSTPYSATPVVAGSSYVVGDLITVTDFTGSVDPQFRVTAVTGGAVDTLVQHTLGTFAFDEAPTATSATTGGTGTGLTVDIALIGWKTQRRDDVDDETDFDWIARGSNLAGSDPFIGIRTFTDSGSPQWNLIGASGYVDAATFFQQPGISPTFGPGARPLGTGTSGAGGIDCRVPLATTGTFELFVSVTGRRVIGVMRQTPVFEMFYLGLFSPQIDDPANKFPLPLIVAGTSGRSAESITTGFLATQAPHAALPHHGGRSGCYKIRWLDGAWDDISAGDGGTDDNYKLAGYFTAISQIDNPAIAAINPAGGTFPATSQLSPSGAPTDAILRSGGGDEGFSPLPFGVGNQTHPVVPYTIFQDKTGSGVSQIVGELEGLFSINGEGLAAEDRVDLPNSEVAVVFPNINSVDNSLFYAMLEI